MPQTLENQETTRRMQRAQQTQRTLENQVLENQDTTRRMLASVDPEREREMELEGLRTQVANQAASLAETVTDGFDGFHMGAGDYVVELMAPQTQSTGGGAQARQNIRLVPRRKGYAVVVAGTVDPVIQAAEIRTFEHVAILHEVRFGRPLEINVEEYTDFLTKLDVVLNLARVRAVRTGPAADLLEARAALRTKASSTGVASLPTTVVFVFVLLLAAFVVYRVMRALHG